MFPQIEILRQFLWLNVGKSSCYEIRTSSLIKNLRFGCLFKVLPAHTNVVFIKVGSSGKHITRTFYVNFNVLLSSRLSVLPRVVVSPREQLIRPGESIRLECRDASGGRSVDLEWSKVSGQLSPRARDSGGVLIISPVTAADAGRYRCIGQTGAGSDEAYAEVSVYG